MRNVIAALLVALTVGFGTDALFGCGGGGPPPPMVLNTDATFETVVPTADVVPVVGDLGGPVDEVM